MGFKLHKLTLNKNSKKMHANFKKYKVKTGPTCWDET